jgi:AmmeMemoRadiSam system protein B
MMKAMAQTLPRLRLDLDFMPSPLAERPGLFVRDPYRYTEAAIIIPPLLVEALPFFDGDHTDLDLQAHLVRLTGELVPHDVVGGLAASLDQHGFLETAGFEQLKQQKQQTFREAPTRLPAHAGAAYPDEDPGLRERLESYAARYPDGHSDGQLPGRLLAIAAPHVSPEGGWRSYAAAYGCLSPADAGKTVVVLGTSHYGPPEKFGLTRKPFVTPLGTLEPDLEVINELVARGGDAVVLEDYCHSIEHSIEFQCVFLQHRLGNGIKLVPILCGPLAESLLTGRRPENNDTVRRFFEALREVGEKLGPRLLWVLGIDLAHIGRRYGDATPAEAETGRMAGVRASDLERLEKVCASDREGFFELVHPGQDALRWCGYSPVYTFLQAVPAARGRLLHYEQWNIDEQSVVSFAGLEFRG